MDKVLSGRLGYTGNLRALFRAFAHADIERALELMMSGSSRRLRGAECADCPPQTWLCMIHTHTFEKPWCVQWPGSS